MIKYKKFLEFFFLCRLQNIKNERKESELICLKHTRKVTVEMQSKFLHSCFASFYFEIKQYVSAMKLFTYSSVDAITHLSNN